MLFALLFGCFFDFDEKTDEAGGDYEYIYLVVCDDSVTTCSVDLKYADLDGVKSGKVTTLPWVTRVNIRNRDDETLSPKLEITTDGKDYGVKVMLTTLFSKNGEVTIKRFPENISYKNMTALEVYKYFISLVLSVEEKSLTTTEKTELLDIVNASIRANYKYSASLGADETYKKISD